jgi:hypothetical protein
MNAAQFTSGIKAVGFGTRMWVGVLVIALICLWIGNPKNQQTVMDGFFR